MKYDYDTEDEARRDGWKFTALVAGCCLAGIVLVMVGAAVVRHVL